MLVLYQIFIIDIDIPKQINKRKKKKIKGVGEMEKNGEMSIKLPREFLFKFIHFGLLFTQTFRKYMC